MDIRKVTGNKKEFIDLLLLADEQENMIDKYLEHGDMFILDDNGVKAECVVTKEADGSYELKNIAVLHDCQGKGYGKGLIDFLFSHYPDCTIMLAGTGDVPSALGFYQKCGFSESHRIKNFFTDNYDHPIFEDGKQLIDMIYLKRKRQENRIYIDDKSFDADEAILHQIEDPDLLPSNIVLSGFEVRLINAMNRKSVLKNYDYVLQHINSLMQILATPGSSPNIAAAAPNVYL